MRARAILALLSMVLVPFLAVVQNSVATYTLPSTTNGAGGWALLGQRWTNLVIGPPGGPAQCISQLSDSICHTAMSGSGRLIFKSSKIAESGAIFNCQRPRRG